MSTADSKHDPRIVALSADPRVPWDIIDAHSLPSPNLASFRDARIEHGLDTARMTTVCAELARLRRDHLPGGVPAQIGTGA